MAFGDSFVDYSMFMRELYHEFANRDWVRIEEVIRFAESDQTDFHSGHLKLKTLKADGRARACVSSGWNSQEARDFP